MTRWGADSAAEVLCAVEGGVGRLLLNRPRAINALTRAMVDTLTEQLTAWADDAAVEAVELRGAGERGLCSGADVRWLRERVLSNAKEAMRFLAAEYHVNAAIASYPKPFTSYMDGITMGGGLGLSVHGTHRLVTERTTVAMPETAIGFFPDVGVLFELARAPRETGTYLALTGVSVDARSAAYAGLADPLDEHRSRLEDAADWIEDCFAGDSAASIVARLESHPHQAARTAAVELRARAPLSVCVTLAALRRAAELSTVADVLAQDLHLAAAFMTPQSDFVEGVRARLVDKDRTPRWQHARIEDVTFAEVEALFA